jgi:dihydroorotase
MIDMVTTMSKLLVMGVPLKDVIRQSTANPARTIQRPELGHLGVGADADILLFCACRKGPSGMRTRRAEPSKAIADCSAR